MMRNDGDGRFGRNQAVEMRDEGREEVKEGGEKHGERSHRKSSRNEQAVVSLEVGEEQIGGKHR